MDNDLTPEVIVGPESPAGERVRILGRSIAVVLFLLTTLAAQAGDARWTPVGDTMRVPQAGTVNDCWSEAPMDAKVFCVPGRPEHDDAFSLLVELTNNAATTTDIVVGFRSMDLTATGGVDYAAVDRTRTLTWDEPTAEIDVEFLDDTDEEGHETFVVEFTAPADVEVEWTHFHFTILDEESIRLIVNDYTGSESSAEVLVDIDFSEGVTWPIEFAIRTEDGTAIAPDDYPAVNESSRASPDPNLGELIGLTRLFPIVNDDIDEPDESFRFVVTGVDKIGLGTSEGVMTILDDDSLPGLTIRDASALEDTGTMAFSVELDRASGHQVTVAYRTWEGDEGDDADAPEDYAETTGTLTFAAGELHRTIEVPIVDDDFFEAKHVNSSSDEQFTVRLRDPQHATLIDDSAFGTIVDDDPGVEVAGWALPESYNANGDGTVRVGVEVHHLRHPGDTVVVSYGTMDGTRDEEDDIWPAKANEDYVPASGTLTFSYTSEGEYDPQLQRFPVTLINDRLPEPTERFFVTVSSAEADGISDGRSEILVFDDDPPSRVIQLTAAPSRMTEDGGPVEVGVTAKLDRSPRADATEVTVSVSGSGAAEAVDFLPVPDFVITIPALETTATGTFTLTPEDDNVDERDEILTIGGESDLPVTGDDVVLEDDDAESVRIALSLDPQRMREAAGTVGVEVTAAFDAGARTRATTVAVSVSGGGAAEAVDFEPVPGFALVIPAGATQGTATFALTPENDRIDETDETVSVTGQSDLPVRGAALELADDDETSTAIALTTDPARVPEDGGAVEVAVTATLAAAGRTVATTVQVTVAGSGVDDAVDFDAIADFAITIVAGSTEGTGTFTLTPEDDYIDEADETLSVVGQADLAVTGTTVELADDDETSMAVALMARPERIAEDGGTAEVQVTATLDLAVRAVATSVRVSVAGSGMPDVVGFARIADFEIVIEAGSKSGTGTFAVVPADDEVNEEDEILAIAGMSDLRVDGTSATLVDDDPASARMVLTAAPSFVPEDGGPVEVTVTAELDRSARREATAVTVSVAGSGDPLAVDFEPVADFAITIAAGAKTGTGAFTLAPVADTTVEADNELTVSGASDLPVEPAVVVLGDDDEASSRVRLWAVPSRVAEDAGPTAVAVTARLNAGARTEATMLTVRVEESGAAGAVDFEPVPVFAITIAANESSGTFTFTLTPEDDDLVETEETLTLRGTSDLPVGRAKVAMVDDDEASTRILLAAVPGSVSEGDGRTEVAVTASLDRDRRQTPTTVTVAVAGGGDPDAVDFDPVQDLEIVIPANAASATGTFVLVPRDDEVDDADETLTISGASDLPVASTVVILADDDEAPTRILLVADPARVSEGAGATAVEVTASLDRGQRGETTRVTVSVVGAGDPDAVDFEAVANFDVVIPAHASSGRGTFTLTPRDDGHAGADEVLTISGTSGLPVTSAAVTLADDDEVSTRLLLFLKVDPAQASEGGGPVRVTVTADIDRGVRREETRIAVVVSGSGDPDAVDFEPVDDFDVVISAYSPSGTGTFTVVPEDDRIAENDETVTVMGMSDLPVRLSVLHLLDDDKDNRPMLSVADVAGTESDGELAFAVTLDRVPGTEVTVGYATTDGTAEAGADYEAVEGTLTFASGESSRTLAVMLLDDVVYERTETFHLDLSSPVNATLAVSAATGTILDDDRAAKAPTRGRALLFESKTRAGRQGFLRVVNHSDETGEMQVEGVDDSGWRVGPINLMIAAGAAKHFNSDDFESGNPDKGIQVGVGPPTAGSWRLEVSSELDLEVLSYARTADGFVTSLHDTAPAASGVHRAVFMNPGGNVDQVSRLRLINPGTEDARVTITGTDDQGTMSAEVVVDLVAETAREWTAAELESGAGADGALGDGEGKWRLEIFSDRAVVAMSLIESPTGNLTNLSTLPRTLGSMPASHTVPLFPSASSAGGRQGFVRVANRSEEAGEVRIEALDRTDREYERVTLAVEAGAVASFNSDDLEMGNDVKGLTGSTGAGEGDWWLELSSDEEIGAFAYVRTADGFLTSMHDLVPEADGGYRVVFFNPAQNPNQVSVLWVVNPGDADAQLTIAGVDDSAASPGSAVRTTVGAGSSRRLTSVELETGVSDALESGALGDGVGKWRLRVESDQPIWVMSLMENPTGHLTNLSTATDRGAPEDRP